MRGGGKGLRVEAIGPCIRREEDEQRQPVEVLEGSCCGLGWADGAGAQEPPIAPGRGFSPLLHVPEGPLLPCPCVPDHCWFLIELVWGHDRQALDRRAARSAMPVPPQMTSC